MPSERFGALNTQPLYNATGRLNRGQAVPNQKWTSPNAGVSKNFSGGEYPLQNRTPFSDLGQSLANPWNSAYSRLNKTSKGRGGGAGGDGGGNGGGNVTIITGGIDATGLKFASQEQQTAKNGPSSLGLDNTSSFFAPQEQQTASTPTTRTRAPRTEEQKAATRALRAQKKEANPAYGTQNKNRTQAPRRPRAQSAGQPASTGSIIQGNQGSQTMIYSPSTSTTMGGGAPGAPFLQMGANLNDLANNKR